jgi:hypothetical protein
MLDLRYRMSFFRATPCCPNHPGTPLPCCGHMGRTFWRVCASLRPRIGREKVGNTVFLQFQSWTIGHGRSPCWRPMDPWSTHCGRPPQWVCASLILWFWVQRVLFFGPFKGLEEGISAFAALSTLRKQRWRDLEEALWGCRLAPMDSLDVREVVCAQHCPWNDINWWSLGGWVAYKRNVQRHNALNKSCIFCAKQWECYEKCIIQQTRTSHYKGLKWWWAKIYDIVYDIVT